MISDLAVLEKEYPLLVAVNRAAHSKFSHKQKYKIECEYTICLISANGIGHTHLNRFSVLYSLSN